MENILPFAPFSLSCSQLSCEVVPGNGVRRGCQTVGFGDETLSEERQQCGQGQSETEVIATTTSFGGGGVRAWAVLEVGDRWKKKRKKK